MAKQGIFGPRFNADDPNDLAKLKKLSPRLFTGIRERETRYGSSPVARRVLSDYPSRLVLPADYKEVITYCNKYRMFPVHHQHNTWAPPGVRWNQDGLNYCWAWALAAAMMDVYARENKLPVPLLAPVSLGWLVNWRNDGNYLESAIRGATERGICEASYVPDPHSRDYRSYHDGWKENALLHRLSPGDIWDLDNSSSSKMIQHCITVLHLGDPLYVALYWWGHALCVSGLLWDESELYNLVWLYRNSHNEDDVIEMVGRNAVPDEAFGPRATITPLE